MKTQNINVCNFFYKRLADLRILAVVIILFLINIAGAIAQKADPIIKIESTATSITYGDLVTLTVTVTGTEGLMPTGTITFRCAEAVLGVRALVDGIATFTYSKFEANEYHAPNAFYSGDENYNSGKSQYLTLTVSPRQLTVTANNQSKKYDGEVFPKSNYTVTYEGFVNGDTQSVLWGNLDFTGSAISATVTGTYTITPQGLTSNDYAITFKDGILTIIDIAMNIDDVEDAFGGVVVFSIPASNVLNFKFTLKQSSKVTIDILSLNGAFIAHAFDGEVSGNGEQIISSSSNLSKGIYLYKISSCEGLSYGKFIVY